jgi:hypothetical protein
LSPFSHGYGRGIKEKRTTKDSCIHPLTNPQENVLETSPRKLPRKGSEITKKGKLGRTQTSLEEPRQIIYTYHEGIQGLASARSSYPLTRSHHEALKLVLEIPSEKEEENSKTNELGAKRWLPSSHPLGYMEET